MELCFSTQTKSTSPGKFFGGGLRIEQLFLNSQQTIICMSNDHAQMGNKGNMRQAEESANAITE